ncbi:MAG: cupin domain-containing protein [Candidatus Omnitrophica bacterium]|nr:cupin domain-containing protein [Candidatus Omnitrophota bacterium]MBI3021513.1 cupin domain-containing protein [Candidatus Omnitrophota bacterium]MBI3083239.1 cupin domain-containing protein [Candidatus Omnitrophota bacterium]
MNKVRVTSCRRDGRLIPRNSRGLRGGSVILRPGETMAWHSTGSREELLIALEGRVRVEAQTSRRSVRSISLKSGSCVFLPEATRHRVVNRSRAAARYLYITAAAT